MNGLSRSTEGSGGETLASSELLLLSVPLLIIVTTVWGNVEGLKREWPRYRKRTGIGPGIGNRNRARNKNREE